jgi:two-component system phosphate regulon sensor histidine kinase PhoR
MLPTAESKDAALSSRLLLNEMIGSMREAIILVERDGVISAANKAASSFLGGQSLEAQQLAAVIEVDVIRQAFRRALEKGERTETQVEIRVRADNRVYDMRVTPLSLADKKGDKSAIGIFYDITRVERLERVRQEFLSNVSHELRTPLTSILAFVETLEDGGLDDHENNKRFLEIIRRNAERMHHLIDDILELSAIEAGKIEIKSNFFLLAPLVDEVWSLMIQKALARNISFVNEVGGGVTIFADQRRVEQILTNLFSNALKFNREGGKIAVTYNSTASFHQIRVGDTGEGIAREQLPRIFERFYRTDTARSRELGGTGLGLAIVKHLSRLHGGEARVESTPGSGSSFIIELPMAGKIT